MSHRCFYSTLNGHFVDRKVTKQPIITHLTYICCVHIHFYGLLFPLFTVFLFFSSKNPYCCHIKTFGEIKQWVYPSKIPDNILKRWRWDPKVFDNNWSGCFINTQREDSRTPTRVWSYTRVFLIESMIPSQWPARHQRALFVCWVVGGWGGCLGNSLVQIIITVTVSAHPTYNRNGS